MNLVSVINGPILCYSVHMLIFYSCHIYINYKNTVCENYKKTVPSTKKKTVLTPLPGPGGWASLRGHSWEAQNSPKWEAFKILIGIPLQMARKCHFEAPEGRDSFGCWGLSFGQVGPNQAPGAPKTKKKVPPNTIKSIASN